MLPQQLRRKLPGWHVSWRMSDLSAKRPKTTLRSAYFRLRSIIVPVSVADVAWRRRLLRRRCEAELAGSRVTALLGGLDVISAPWCPCRRCWRIWRGRLGIQTRPCGRALLQAEHRQRWQTRQRAIERHARHTAAALRLRELARLPHHQTMVRGHFHQGDLLQSCVSCRCSDGDRPQPTHWYADAVPCKLAVSYMMSFPLSRVPLWVQAVAWSACHRAVYQGEPALPQARLTCWQPTSHNARPCLYPASVCAVETNTPAEPWEPA